MRSPQCAAVFLSLFTLIAFGTYINWTSPITLPKQDSSLSHSKSVWKPLPITALSLLGVTEGNIDGSNLSRMLLLNYSLELKEIIPEADAYWNKKQHEIFHKLESTANISFICGASPDGSSHIKDFQTYPDLFKQFVLYSGCRNFSLLINQPNKCSQNQTFLLLAIKSIPKNFIQRQAVRETWGREMDYSGLQVRTVFLLGSDKDGSGPDLQHLVRFESEHFGDILQWDFQDSFLNLTLKDNLFLKWTSLHCPNARFIFKGDDDVFANTFTIVQYLKSMELQRANALYLGHVVTNASPFRESKSKYFIPESFYIGAYPPYTGGGGFVFSGLLAKWLFLISQYIEFYPIDDVYTGLCFTALRVEPQMHPEFQTFDIAEKERNNPCVHKKLLLVHQRSPQQLLHLWRRIQDPGLQC